jgi:hypothetical protein
MTANDDLERRIADFYATEAPRRAPDWVLASTLATVDTTRQRRAFVALPWRLPHMNVYAKAAVAIVAVIAVAGIALALLRPDPRPGSAPLRRRVLPRRSCHPFLPRAASSHRGCIPSPRAFLSR